MQIGMVGMGRMGGNMARRLVLTGTKVVALDLNADVIAALAKDGIKRRHQCDRLAPCSRNRASSG